MNKNTLKKIYYSLTKNIPWYEVNNDRSNVNKQIKIEQKILNLLSTKSFKITNTNFIDVNKQPVEELPHFMKIIWPKGTDSSYFKSYQVLEYYKDLGMIKFKLTLSNSTSKEYILKGFDTWEDIIRQAEEQIKSTLESNEVQEYLSSMNFKVFLGKVDDSLLYELIKNIFLNPFIKKGTVSFDITSIDFKNGKFNLNYKWTIDPKFSQIIEIKSEYVDFLNKQKELLKKFSESKEFMDSLNNLKILDLNNNEQLNEKIKIYLEDKIEFYEIKNLKFDVINLNYFNNNIIIKISDKVLNISEHKEYLSQTLIRLNKEKQKINEIINEFEFLDQIKQLYIENKIDDKNEIDNLLSNYNLSTNEYEFTQIINTNFPFLMIQLTKKEDNIQVTNNISLYDKYELLKDSRVFNNGEMYLITINDLNFLRLIMDYYDESIYKNNANIFDYIIQKYESPWKNEIYKNPFSLNVEINNSNNFFKIISIVSGSYKEKILFSKKIIEKIKLDNYLNSIVNDENFINYFKHLKFEELNNLKDFELKNLNNILLTKEEILKFLEEFEIKINTSFTVPYNSINVDFNIQNQQHIKKTINVKSNTYKSLVSLSADLSFREELNSYAQFLFENDLNDEIEFNKIKDLINKYTNGIVFKNFNFNKVEKDNLIYLGVQFDYMFPQIEWEIQKIDKEININQVINELTNTIEEILSDQNEIFNETKNTYILKEALEKINSNKFNSLLEYDGTIIINYQIENNNPLITFEILIPSINININSYANYFPIIKNEWIKLENNLTDENKMILIKYINDNKSLSYSRNRTIYNQIFSNIEFNKYFKLNKLSFEFKEDRIEVFYSNKFISNIN